MRFPAAKESPSATTGPLADPASGRSWPAWAAAGRASASSVATAKVVPARRRHLKPSRMRRLPFTFDFSPLMATSGKPLPTKKYITNAVPGMEHEKPADQDRGDSLAGLRGP